MLHAVLIQCFATWTLPNLCFCVSFLVSWSCFDFFYYYYYFELSLLLLFTPLLTLVFISFWTQFGFVSLPFNKSLVLRLHPCACPFHDIQQTLEFIQSGVKNKKTSIHWVAVLFVEKGRKRMARLVRADEKTTATKVFTLYDHGQQKSISKSTTLIILM